MSKTLKNLTMILVAAVVSTAISRTVVLITDQTRSPTSVTQAELEAQINTSDGAFLYLKANFPNDYDAMVKRILASIHSGATQDQVRKLSFSEVASFRRSHAKYVADAPDDLLKEIAASMADLHGAVRAKQGPEKCGEFAQNGALAILDNIDLYVDITTKQALLIFRAINIGTKNQNSTKQVSESDWLKILETMQNGGDPDTYLSLLSKQKYGDPQYCSAIISMLRAISITEGEEAHRVRANILTEIAGS